MTCDMMEWNTIANYEMAVKGKCVCIILNKPERGEYYIVFVSICEVKVGELVWLNGVGFRQTLVMHAGAKSDHDGFDLESRVNVSICSETFCWTLAALSRSNFPWPVWSAASCLRNLAIIKF